MAIFKKCPHCKSKLGFKITVLLGGTHEFESDFNGNILKNVRDGCDKIEMYGSCLNCKKSIPSDNLKITF